MARLFAAIQMCEEVWLGVDIWTVGGMSNLCLPGDEQPVFTWGWAPVTPTAWPYKLAARIHIFWWHMFWGELCLVFDN